MILRQLLAAFSVLVILTACNGDSNNKASSDPEMDIPSEIPSTGQFVDSAVGGIAYKTETQSGITDEEGNFDFLPGETVTFFLGDIELPPVPATGRITPASFGFGTPNDAVALNIVRLLLSLDSDGNPNNGITIPQEFLESDIGIDFSESDEEQFETGLDLLIDELAPEGFNGGIVALSDAQAHAEQTVNSLLLELAGGFSGISEGFFFGEENELSVYNLQLEEGIDNDCDSIESTMPQRGISSDFSCPNEQWVLRRLSLDIEGEYSICTIPLYSPYSMVSIIPSSAKEMSIVECDLDEEGQWSLDENNLLVLTPNSREVRRDLTPKITYVQLGDYRPQLRGYNVCGRNSVAELSNCAGDDENDLLFLDQELAGDIQKTLMDELLAVVCQAAIDSSSSLPTEYSCLELLGRDTIIDACFPDGSSDFSSELVSSPFYQANTQLCNTIGIEE